MRLPAERQCQRGQRGYRGSQAGRGRSLWGGANRHGVVTASGRLEVPDDGAGGAQQHALHGNRLPPGGRAGEERYIPTCLTTSLSVPTCLTYTLSTCLSVCLSVYLCVQFLLKVEGWVQACSEGPLPSATAELEAATKKHQELNEEISANYTQVPVCLSLQSSVCLTVHLSV